MKDQLDGWWRSQLSEELRDRLLAVGDGPLPPELALEVWRRSGTVHAVDHIGDHSGTWEWRISPEVMAFLRARTTTEPDGERAGTSTERHLEGSHGQS